MWGWLTQNSTHRTGSSTCGGGGGKEKDCAVNVTITLTRYANPTNYVNPTNIAANPTNVSRLHLDPMTLAWESYADLARVTILLSYSFV
jgi:hypothetical protein